MTLKNNRAPLLCYFKRCASFQSHLWIQTGVTVRKRPIWFKLGDFLYRVTLRFDGWPWKTIWYLFYESTSFVHGFVAMCEFNLELHSGNAQIGAKFVLTSVTLTFDPWTWLFAWTLLLSLVITPETVMLVWWREHNEKGVTDRRTDGRTDERTEPLIELLSRIKKIFRYLTLKIS